MPFRFVFSNAALDDLMEIRAFIAADSPAAANRWTDELETACRELAEMPRMFNVIEEGDAIGYQWRSFNHYSHRVIYRIDEGDQTVVVVRVVHGRQMPFSPRHLPE